MFLYSIPFIFVFIQLSYFANAYAVKAYEVVEAQAIGIGSISSSSLSLSQSLSIATTKRVPSIFISKEPFSSTTGTAVSVQNEAAKIPIEFSQTNAILRSLQIEFSQSTKSSECYHIEFSPFNNY